MPTESLLNLDQLLAPISADQPTGPNVHGTEEADRYNAVTRIQLRHFPNAKGWQQRYRTSCLKGTAHPAQEDSANWRIVAEHATTCLASQSKDLWVSAYLLVALTYRQGFAGLGQGLRFLAEMIKQHGTQLHPAEQPLSELRKASPDIEDALRFAPLTDEAHGAHARIDFVIANDISAYTPEQLAPYLAQDTPLRDQLQVDLAETSQEHLQETAAEIQRCEEALTVLDQEIRANFSDPRFANEYPSFDAIRKELKACRGIIEPFLKVPVEAEPAAGGTESTIPSSSTSDTGPQTRQKALRQLEEIAAYFQRIEPLSPLPYVIRRAVAWGNMSLPEVLAELLSEEERNKLKERAGIPMHMQPPPP